MNIKQVSNQTNAETSVVTEGTLEKGNDNEKVFYNAASISCPAADKGSGVTILGCRVSSPYVFVSEITPPPSFLRRITKVISQCEWRPCFEKAAKRKRDWFEALRKVDGLVGSLEGDALKCLLRMIWGKSERKVPHEYLAFFQAIRFSALSLRCLCFSRFWLTPSIPRSLRSPSLSSLPL